MSQKTEGRKRTPAMLELLAVAREALARRLRVIERSNLLVPGSGSEGAFEARLRAAIKKAEEAR